MECAGFRWHGDSSRWLLIQAGTHISLPVEPRENCYNAALDAAVTEYQEKGRVFSPQNWLKAKDSLNKVQASLRMYMGMMGSMPGGNELKQRLVLDAATFSLRWSAD